MTPDWLHQLTWFAAGIAATGAFWYFLSQRNYHATLWTGFAAVVLALLAVVFQVRNDLIRRETGSTTALQEVPTSPAIQPALDAKQGGLPAGGPNDAPSKPASGQATKAAGAGQSVTVQGSPGTTVYQAGRDLVAPGAQRDPRGIQSITVEARLTCTLKSGSELPPAEVEFMPIGDSHAYLEGPQGRVRLGFVSPVRFRQLQGDRVTVINRFSIGSASELERRPLAALLAFSTLSTPIVTVVYGSSLDRIMLLEVEVVVNGEQLWYGNFTYDVVFQQGPRFAVPLTDLHKQIMK